MYFQASVHSGTCNFSQVGFMANARFWKINVLENVFLKNDFQGSVFLENDFQGSVFLQGVRIPQYCG